MDRLILINAKGIVSIIVSNMDWSKRTAKLNIIPSK